MARLAREESGVVVMGDGTDQTCLILEEHGAIDQLGEKIDRQLQMQAREGKPADPSLILYDLACLSNLARCRTSSGARS